MGAPLTAAAFLLGTPAPYGRLVGVGGVGTGTFFALEGDHDLGRSESRPARLLDVRDYCKLHIVAHYPALLLGAQASGDPFHVVPAARVGDDEAGRRLWQEMTAAGMDLRFLEAVAGAPTLQSVCFQYPDGSGGNITTCDSAASRLMPSDLDRLAPLVDRRTIVLAAPEVPLAVRQRLLRIGTGRRALRAAAIASAEAGECFALGFFADVDLLALNQDEAAAVAGVPYEPADVGRLLDACAGKLLAAQREMRVVVTVGADGAYAFDSGRWHRVPPLRVPVESTAGAGDALLGGLLTGLALGLPLVDRAPGGGTLADRPVESALGLGVLVASFKLRSRHTIPPDVGLAPLRAFAQEHAVRFGERLSDSIGGP